MKMTCQFCVRYGIDDKNGVTIKSYLLPADINVMIALCLSLSCGFVSESKCVSCDTESEPK